MATKVRKTNRDTHMFGRQTKTVTLHVFDDNGDLKGEFAIQYVGSLRDRLTGNAIDGKLDNVSKGIFAEILQAIEPQKTIFNID